MTLALQHMEVLCYHGWKVRIYKVCMAKQFGPQRLRYDTFISRLCFARNLRYRRCAHYDRTALLLDDFQYGGGSVVIR